MTEDLKQRLIDSITWMIVDIKWRADQSKGNVDNGMLGEYSDKLLEAMAVLAELEDL